MFECRRCRNVFPDNTEECPVCGTVNKALFNKNVAPIKFLIYSADLLVLLMNFVTLIICVTCSHYCYVYEYGLFAARRAYWEVYPLLIPIDIGCILCTVAIPLVSVVARKKMMRRQRAGVKITICLYAALFLLNVLYPIATFLATEILTPILFVLLATVTVFFIIAVIISILLLSNDGFCF